MLFNDGVFAAVFGRQAVVFVVLAFSAGVSVSIWTWSSGLCGASLHS